MIFVLKNQVHILSQLSSDGGETSPWCFIKKINFSRSSTKSPNPGPTHIQQHLHPYETGQPQTCTLVYDRQGDFFYLKLEIRPCGESNLA
jgi:hypothetical protein